MTTRVGFIGLGNMGKQMAINIAKAGFDLMVYDLRAEPMRELTALGAKAARSADEIGAHGEIVEVVVVDDRQVEAALLGEGGALAKSLCYMVGGDKAAFERCRPIFATSGANIFHLGALGSGAITKLAHNLIVYVNMLAASEGMRLAEKAGVDLKSMEQVVHAGAGQSRVADHWSQQRKLKDTYTSGPRGLMELMHKDLRLALELGHDLGLSLPGAALTQQMLQRVLEIED